MRVLVTGATGFIGGWVLNSLLQRGHEVIAITSRARPNFDARRVSWIEADLLEPKVAAVVLETLCPEGLIHCAWDTTHGAYWNSADNLKWLAGSLELIEAFQRCGGRRAVFAGTSAEYDWSSGGLFNETDSLIEPSTLYGTCKDSLRRIVERWSATRDLSWAWGRVFCPFGQGEKPDRLIPRIILKLLAGASLPFDSGRLIRDFICVEDLGDAFATLLDSSLSGPINLSTGRGMPIRELISLIADYLGRRSQVVFDVLPDPTNEPARIVADIERLSAELAWSPSETLERRLFQTCDWWQAVSRDHRLVT